MDKIRQTSPIILAVIAVLFIGFMVVSDMDLGNVMSQSDQSTTAIGSVNGEDILYSEFERRVEQQMERQRAERGPDVDIDDEPIRQQVWNQMVEEILLRQTAEKLGITVTDAEVREVMLEDPPAEWRQSFTDSTGRFNRELYLQLMTNPAKIRDLNPDPEAYTNFYKQILMLEDFVRSSRLQQKIQNAVTASVSALPTSYLQQQYQVANSSSEVSYVSVNTASVRDQDVQVSDAEVEQYYNKYKDFYKQKPSRQLKYIVFPLAPSKQDTASAQRKIEKLVEALRDVGTDKVRRDSIFDDAVTNYNGRADDYQLIKDIDPMKYSYIANVPDGEIVGPVRLTDGVYFFRVDGRRSGTNEVVKASHILIQFGTNKDSAKAEATRILGLAKGGEDFAELAGKYSADPGSKMKGGDLGYFGKGQMVKPFEEAAFGAAPGSIVGPTESDFGFHIIKVEDKKSEELKFTEVSFNPIMSTATRNQTLALAQQMKQQIEDGQPIDSVAKRAGYEASASGFFQRSSPVLGSASLTLFAFESDPGAVSDPVTIKQINGVVLAQVSDARTEGIKPLVDMKEEIRTRLIRQKKLDKVKAQAEAIQRKIAAAGSIEAAQALDSTIRAETITVKNNGQVPSMGMEPAFTTAAFKLPVNKVSEPIRGERAYFVMQVKNRTEANMSGFEAQRQSIYQGQIERLKNSAFYMWMNTVKENADIEDNRMSVYRM